MFKKCKNARHDKIWPKMRKSVRKMSIFAIKCWKFCDKSDLKSTFYVHLYCKKAFRSSGPEHTKYTKKNWTWVWPPPFLFWLWWVLCMCVFKVGSLKNTSSQHSHCSLSQLFNEYTIFKIVPNHNLSMTHCWYCHQRLLLHKEEYPEG